MANSEKPLYINDQQWSVLTEFDNPWPWLQTRRFRTQPAGLKIPGSDSEIDPWIPFLPNDLIEGEVGIGEHKRRLNRVVITTDSGIGKTATTEYLEYRFNLPDTRKTCFRLTVADICRADGPLGSSSTEVNVNLIEFLAGRIRNASTKLSWGVQESRQYVRRIARTGRLVLVIDGLDQPAGSIERLTTVLESPFWNQTQIILAGRPYSLNRHRDDFLNSPNWTFLRLEELTPTQQATYLGDRYQKIPDEARSILSIPRVLYYLKHKMSEAEIAAAKTPADVFYGAIKEMINQALAGSDIARRLGAESRSH